MEQIDLSKLKEPLDEKAITKHPTKTYLSSIKAVYVTERFNEVFGIGKWTQKVEKEYVNHDTGMVVVKVIFEVPTLNIYYESFGGNDNGGADSKNFDLGDAYKGATTDALTKIGSYLGVAIDVFKGLNDNQTNKPINKTNVIKKTLTQQDVDNKWNGKIYSNKYVYIDNVKCEIPTEQVVKLKLHKKYKAD